MFTNFLSSIIHYQEPQIFRNIRVLFVLESLFWSLVLDLGKLVFTMTDRLTYDEIGKVMLGFEFSVKNIVPSILKT